MLRRVITSLFTLTVLFVGAPVFAATSTTGDSSNTTPANQSTTSPEITNGLCAGANLSFGSDCNSGGITSAEANAKINKIIHEIINIFSVVVGVVSIIMIIIGGLKYITSGGDSTNVTGAKNTILYAVIGLVVVSLAQVMVRFVLNKVSQ